MSYPTKFVKVITPIAFAISLAACGGDGVTFGGGGTGDADTKQVQQAKTIELTASTRQLFSDGSVPVIITAIAKNENNNGIPKADIVFSVDNNATITPDGEGEGSIKTATLTPSLAKNRTLKVTATSGKASKTIIVDVVGTTVVIDGPSSITINKEVPFVLKLKDGADKPISHQEVVLTSSAGNTISTESNYKTDKNGEIPFTLLGLQSGSDILTAEVLGASLSMDVEISPDEFELTGLAKEININTSQQLKFTWKKSGIPQKNKTINVSTTRGDLTQTSVTTDDLGEAMIEISSKTAGSTVITAATNDGLSTSTDAEFVATTPAYLNTQADPTLITPNGSSTIISKIRDINDNPVKNKVIDFRLEDTVNGKLSASTAVTDSLGRASVSYTAGDSSSEKDGVKINTFIQGYEGVVEADQITLTVGSNALRIVLGHDHLMEADRVYYIKHFGVIVTDSAGNPVKEQKVDFTIIPTHYYKGTMVPRGEGWGRDRTATCKSEDWDNDGNLDVGEDANGNGRLDPTHDASVTGTGVTDETGRIVVQVIYPKSRALWSRQRITSSVLVAGTEFIEQTDFDLPVSAGDVSDIEIAPPNGVSPYGTSDKCDTIDSEAEAIVPYTVVDALGVPVLTLANDIWYKVANPYNSADNVSYTIKVDPDHVSKINVESGPYSSFRITDNDPYFDSTGFNLSLETGSNSKPLFYQDESVVEPEDQEAPIVTLNGAATVTVPLNGTYTELSANAADAVDGVVTVTKVGTVDTTTAGTYTLFYSAEDSAGNKSEPITRTVIVTP